MVSSVDVSINLNDNTSFSIESFESKLPNFQYSTFYLERLYNKLDSKSCDASGITQNQKDRRMSVALVVSAIAAAFFQNYWLTLPLGLGSCYYGLSFFCYDLDSKEVRSKVQENILRWSFVDLTANFTFEDMLQYDLLKKFTEFYTTYQKVQIYAHIKDLIDFRKKTLIDIQQKHAEFLLRHPQHPVENSTNIHSAYILRSTYKEKMDLVIEERYRKILEGAFLKEDLQ